MARVLYMVTTTLPDQAMAEEFLDWLVGGHIGDVIKGGAESGMVVRLESPGSVPRVLAQYVFASRAALDRYVEVEAPRLRAEGLARFPASRGVIFERQIGVIEHTEGDQGPPKS